MYKRIKQALHDCVTAAKVMLQPESSYRASSLAFSTLLSLVPMVAVFVFIMTQFPTFTQLNSLATNYVMANFIPTSSNEILPYLDKFSSQASQLPILSILLLFISTTLTVISIDNSMNSIWHKKSRKKSLLSLLIYPLIILLIPVFIGAIALISSFIFYLFSYLPTVKVISFIIPWLINAVMLSLLYLVTTSVKISWRDTYLGSLVASLLLELSKIGFAAYVNQFSNYDLIYGALATIPVLLIWLYIFWLIILYGALVVKMRFDRIVG